MTLSGWTSGSVGGKGAQIEESKHASITTALNPLTWLLPQLLSPLPFPLTRPGIAPFHSPATPSAATTARITPIEERGGSTMIAAPDDPAPATAMRLAAPAACSRVLISSMGEVTAAARPPLRLPLRICNKGDRDSRQGHAGPTNVICAAGPRT